MQQQIWGGVYIHWHFSSSIDTVVLPIILLLIQSSYVLTVVFFWFWKLFFILIAFAFSICLKKTSYLCRFVLMLCAVWLRYSADVVPVITKRSMMISVAIYRNWKGISSKCTLGKCRLHSVVCGEYIFWPFTINLFGNCVAFGLEYLPLYNIVECYLLRGCCCGYMVIWLLSQMSEFWSIFYILKTFLSYLSILTL